MFPQGSGLGFGSHQPVDFVCYSWFVGILVYFTVERYDSLLCTIGYRSGPINSHDMRGEWINVCVMRVGVIQSLAPVILDRSIIPDRLFKPVIPVS